MSNQQQNYNKNMSYKNKNKIQKKKKYYPQKKQNHSQKFGSFFNGNLAQNMSFGGKNHALSGYVERKVYIKDRYGNVQQASEKQFFNSGPNIRRVEINDDESDF